MVLDSTKVAALAIFLFSGYCPQGHASDFETDAKPLLIQYCGECHSGDDPSGDVDFSRITTRSGVEEAFELWESVVNHLRSNTMPPADRPQPSDQQRQQIYDWYDRFASQAESKPAVFRSRRLSVIEYRNTLRSLLGFDLEVDVIEAEQTLSERSMVVKLLPVDPPGKSGFTNDTHDNALSSKAWDQYAYVADAAIEELFSADRQDALRSLAGIDQLDSFGVFEARSLIKNFVRLAYRRNVEPSFLAQHTDRVLERSEESLVAALKLELKTILMSPGFLYRGLLMPIDEPGQQDVDNFELAERLSYFLWADMPDGELLRAAEQASFSDSATLHGQIDRMIQSPKSRSLSEVFAFQWLTLAQIESVSNNPPIMVALKTQPIDFFDYLIRQDRPLLELIDSDTTFINPHTARMYGKDSKQMQKYSKQKGIEVEIVSNQKITLHETHERGGILTMPGVLAMNKGPIIRGTWILERILGQHLPEPPANVGQVPANPKGKKLSFRERFEMHRSEKTCAACHDKIDPLGFALAAFDSNGKFLKAKNYQPSKKELKAGIVAAPKNIDTSGKLPSGETFEDIVGLKKILTSTKRETVIKNIVKRLLSYALCRKLTIHDQPTVNSITRDMIQSDGTWHDLIHAVADSLPFRETILPAE